MELFTNIALKALKILQSMWYQHEIELINREADKLLSKAKDIKLIGNLSRN